METEERVPIMFFFFGGVGVSGNVTPRSTPRGEIRLI